MKIYLVGGAVRDELLGLTIKEKDWVVVNASTEEMLKLGYKQVGKEFPVFLHPITKEEYALARKERKVQPGYKGFTFDTSPAVSLEEDLMRRDLTINAMAQTQEGKLIDPYHGKEDLENKLLRHVSPAFAEDPVRVLRVGRFLARYAHLGFKVAPETITLMKEMVASGEIDSLVAERVWKELERALAEKNPEKFFQVLAECHGLEKLFPRFSLDSFGMQALHKAAETHSSALIRFAALLHHLSEVEIATLCRRYKVPNEYHELAKLVSLNFSRALQNKKLSPEELLDLFAKLDIYRRIIRFQNFLATCKAIAFSREQFFDAEWLSEMAQLARSVDIQKLLNKGLTGQELAQALKNERLKKLRDWYHKL